MNPYLIYGLWVLAIALFFNSLYIRNLRINKNFANNAIPIEAIIDSVAIDSAEDDTVTFRLGVN